MNTCIRRTPPMIFARNTSSLAAISMLAGLAPCTIASASLEPLPTTPQATASAADENADGFASLRSDFDALSRYLRSRGGIGSGERQDLLALRSRLEAFAAAHPDDNRPAALEIQISLWLRDNAAVDAAFERLVTAAPDNTALRRRWAQAVMAFNDWPRAAEILSDAALAADAQALVDRVRCLKNLNRYAEATDLLATRDAEAADAIATASQATALQVELEGLMADWAAEEALLAAEADADALPRVAVDTDRGRIVLELFEDQAPYTTANFIELVESGFYDDTAFHRVLPGFMAQGGDPNTRTGAEGVPGNGGPGWTIPDESVRSDQRLHFADRLAMAKPGDPENPGRAKPNSAGSQFYITVVPTPHLDADYTVFGRVLEGAEISRALQQGDRIRSAKVLRKRDHDYTPVKLGVEAPPAEADSTEADPTP
ncbi:MAG: peptidylprolyl isomerase [Phycisphaerales bacterium]